MSNGQQKTKKGRRAWYFAQQRGLCCLQITDGCTARGGLMSLDVDKLAPNFASFEHLMPRSKLRKNKAESDECARVQLLACRTCNAKKGARVADETMIAVAALFWQRWRNEALDLSLAAKRAERDIPTPAHTRAA